MTGVSLERLADTLYPKPEPKNSTAYGTVESINADGSYQVKLNASATTTRCAKLCDAEVTDRVLVLIQANGHCAALGRVGGSVDFVVSEGETDGWSWRKWESGIAECWGEFFHSFAISSKSGSAYYTSSAYYETYPSGLFNATPKYCAVTGFSSNGVGIDGYQIGDGETSARTPNYYPYRLESASNNASAYVQIHALGRWK